MSPSTDPVFASDTETLRRTIVLPTGMAITFGCSRPIAPPAEDEVTNDMDLEMDWDRPEML